MPKPNNPMVVTLDQFDQMRDSFKAHYFLSQCDVNFGGQEIQVSWDSFSLAIYNFTSTYKVAESSVVVRFVHCYDVTNSVLYLRMQILTMDPTRDPYIYTLNDSVCDWYELSNGVI